MEDNLNKEGIILLSATIIIGSILFIGVVKLAKSSFKISGPKFEEIDSTNSLRKQRRYMDDLKDKQKDYMRDQQQRIKDMQR
jgi:hypothetical protein